MKTKLLINLLTFASVASVIISGGCARQSASEEKSYSNPAASPQEVKTAAPESAAEAPTPVKKDSAKSTGEKTDQTGAAGNSLIGVIKTPPEDGFGCYLVLPADIDKTSDKRRYLLVVEDDGSGLMNVGGSDTRLKNEKSSEVKSSGGKKRFVWIYSANAVKVTVNLTQTKTSNDGENTHFDAVIKADKDGRTQSMQAKGFCGG